MCEYFSNPRFNLILNLSILKCIPTSFLLIVASRGKTRKMGRETNESEQSILPSPLEHITERFYFYIPEKFQKNPFGLHSNLISGFQCPSLPSVSLYLSFLVCDVTAFQGPSIISSRYPKLPVKNGLLLRFAAAAFYRSLSRHKTSFLLVV